MIKRFGSAALALALAGSLVPSALAIRTDHPLLIATKDESVSDVLRDAELPANVEMAELTEATELGDTIPMIDLTVPMTDLIIPGGYKTVIALNGGAALNTIALPAEANGLIPMRLVTEADYGFADWFQDENLGYFTLDGNRVEVSFADNSVKVNGEAVEATATVIDGVTYLPVDIIAGLEGYEVVETEDGYAISTPNGAHLVKLAREIIAQTEAATSMKTSLEDLDSFMGITSANYTEVASFAGMITRPDMLFIGKLAEDADVEAAKAELQARIDNAKETFSWYLSQNLYIAEEARIVESNGYLALLMVPNSELAEELFIDGVAEPAGESETPAGTTEAAELTEATELGDTVPMAELTEATEA